MTARIAESMLKSVISTSLNVPAHSRNKRDKSSAGASFPVLHPVMARARPRRCSENDTLRSRQTARGEGSRPTKPRNDVAGRVAIVPIVAGVYFSLRCRTRATSPTRICLRAGSTTYYQLFCEEFFQHQLAFDRSSLTRLRQRWVTSSWLR